MSRPALCSWDGDRDQLAPGLDHQHWCKVPVSPACCLQPTWCERAEGTAVSAHPAAHVCDGTGATEDVLSVPLFGQNLLGVCDCTEAPRLTTHEDLRGWL